ncbi:MAG: DUF4097 domain-containing protein [Oscillospiraceae bacterium]|nr:DUF4097 domain-containing protein [Oscillospiraceae bacterium]
MVLGVAFIAVGFAMGAMGGYATLGVGGFRIGSHGDGSGVRLAETGLEPFANVIVRTSEAKVQLIPSDRYGIDAYLPESRRPIEWGVDGGTLTVGAADGGGFSFRLFDLGFMLEGGSDYYVRIYYPRDAAFESVDVRTASGTVDVEAPYVASLSLVTASGDVRADVGGFQTAYVKTASGKARFAGTGSGDASINITSTSGRVDAAVAGCSELTVGSVSGKVAVVCEGHMNKVRLNAVSGSLDFKGATWAELRAETVSGGIALNGDMAGGKEGGVTYAKSVSGKVTVSLAGGRDGYGYSMSSTSGSITLDGVRVYSPARRTASEPGGNEVTISTVSGSIRLDMGK